MSGNECCKQCGGPLSAIQVKRGRPYCSRGCYGMSLRGVRVPNVKHRMVTRKDHPIAPPSGVLAIARVNLYDKIGPGTHPCNWCKKVISWDAELYSDTAIVADHLNWDSENDEPENLVPSCNACNSHRRKTGHSKTLSPEEPTLMRGGRPTRAVHRECEFCQSDFLAVPADIRNGKGRFCSRPCARKVSRGK